MMRRPALIAMLTLSVLLVSAAGAGAADTKLVSIGAGLQGPKGLRATVYATGLAHVSAFAFDAKGRLWVTTSAATGHGADGVYVVAKAGATPVKVIAGLKGPLGLVWHDGTLYVASIGQVDAFSQLSGTRFAKRTRILTEPAGHGWNQNLVLAPNGRLIMSIASACDHCATTSRWSASIISFDLDGSHVKTYASRVRAAFGLAFYPGTSTLLASMNQRDDLGAKTPGDALAVVRAGDDWRFPACYDQGGSACSGVPAVLASLGKHAAAGGVAVVTGRLGSDGRDGRPRARVGARQRAARRAHRLGRRRSPAAGPRRSCAASRTRCRCWPRRAGPLFVGDWTTGRIYRVARG